MALPTFLAATVIETPSVDVLALGPEIALATAGVAIVLVRSLLRARSLTMPLCLVLAFGGVLAAGVLELRLWNVVRDDGAITTVAGLLRVDLFAVFLGVVVLAATALALLL